MTEIMAKRMLAKWRRKHGAWFLTFAIEGWDDEHSLYVSGRLSRRFAVVLGRLLLARDLGEKSKYIHLVSAKKEQ